MKHTKNYMDAMWVVENPEKYDNRDVARANSFIEAYNEGYNKALSLSAVVGRSEQLPNMTLEQAIEKAKPNLDKITDVDKHLDNIR